MAIIMKKYVLTIFAIMGSLLPSIAQSDSDYHPFLKEGKVWNIRLDEGGLLEVIEGQIYRYRQTTYYSLSISGDTVVGDKTYKKMFRRPTTVLRKYYAPAEMAGKEETFDLTGECSLWHELWREDGQKVYAFLYDKEELRYDFSAEPGMMVNVSSVLTDILSIDDISLYGKNLRRFHIAMHDYQDQYDRVWIEGVGHPDGPFRVWGREVNDGRSYQLLSCYEDGECIYSVEEYEKMEQALPILNRPISEPSAYPGNVPLFDLQGRRLTSKPTQKGVYIENGRKQIK